jgi:iron(III) transport system substrate-binding protein
LIAYNGLNWSRQGITGVLDRKKDRETATMKRERLNFWLALGVVGVALAGAPGCGSQKARVVLYCAQDQEFADQVLGEFIHGTGLKVDPKFDTEADKSVSLYVELVNEKARPRCDVHWNNEILSTIRLQRQGLLEPYRSLSAAPYPASARARDDTWHAFAARARILIINTNQVREADRPRSLLDLTDARWKGRMAMAKPQFGTSATQAACLFEVLGRERARNYYLGLRENDVKIVPGNKQVAEGVGQGQFAVGITDTDDAIAEVEAGRPVTILFPDRDRSHGDRMGTLFIPNTVAVIRGCPNLEGARKLVDYLLSPEVEAKLAETASHQIPLNPQVKAHLPREIERPEAVKTMEVDFDKAADLWDEVQTFLRNEFARP